MTTCWPSSQVHQPASPTAHWRCAFARPMVPGTRSIAPCKEPAPHSPMARVSVFRSGTTRPGSAAFCLGASTSQPGAQRGWRRADGTLFQILDATAEHSANRIRTGEGFRVGSGEAFHSLGERVQLGGERNERGGLDPPPSFSLCPRHASPSTKIDNPGRRNKLQVGSELDAPSAPKATR